MTDFVLPVEADLSWQALAHILIQVQISHGTPKRLHISKSDEPVAKELVWDDPICGSELVVDPSLEEGIWYVEDENGLKYWGNRGNYA